MKRDFNVSNTFISSNQRRVVNRATRPSFSKDLFDKKLQNLQTNAESGDYQSQIRIEAIHRLVDPCLHFYESDVQRILIKGYPPQVEKGLRLYRLMNRLKIFCEPVGDQVGLACRVRLINLEEITFPQLMDVKDASNLVLRATDKSKDTKNFNGFELLNPDEKALYQRSKPYFGGRKRPTLKSLAISLLGEGNEIFSDRSFSNYIAAVQDFRNKHKDDLGYSWHFIAGVDSYNRNPETGREVASMVMQTTAKTLREIALPNISFTFAESMMGAQLVPKSLLESVRTVSVGMNALAAHHKRATEGLASVFSQGFDTHGMLSDSFGSHVKGLNTLAECMKGLEASNRALIERTMGGLLAGFTGGDGFKFFPVPKFGEGFK